MTRCFSNEWFFFLSCVTKRCWDVALGPLKQIPMNLFIMYMSGNTISIFPIMMVCMMAWRPIQALMSMSASEYGRSQSVIKPYGGVYFWVAFQSFHFAPS